MDKKSNIKIFFKAGFDGQSIGACYQCQRILMLSVIKCTSGVMPEFKAIPVNISKPPQEFKELGLHLRVPALFVESKNKNSSEPVDIVDDIVLALDNEYPGGILENDLETVAENVVRDFFSKFCHVVRGVAKDFSNLETELVKIDGHLESVSAQFPLANKLFLCGESLAHVDCEVLPKLHQVRVALEAIKGYELPRCLKFLWRYLHSAYSEPAFVKYCPSDTEILLHWLDTGSARLSPRQQQLLAENKGRAASYSFSVPVTATRVVLE